MREGVEQHAGGIGVVQRHRYAARVRRLADGRHVLHFHRHRAGAFGPDQRGVRTNERGDAGADERIVGLDLDAQALEHAGGHFLVGTVGAVRH